MEDSEEEVKAAFNFLQKWPRFCVLALSLPERLTMHGNLPLSVGWHPRRKRSGRGLEGPVVKSRRLTGEGGVLEVSKADSADW